MGSSLFLSMLLIAAAERPDLTGAITTVDGDPVWGATVRIYEAQLRKGVNRCRADAYPDCTRLAVVDKLGRFCIEDLDPRLLFRVLIVANGYDPVFAEMVDPAVGPLKVTIARREVQQLDLQCLIHGRVLDPHGLPVVGATLTLVHARIGGRWRLGSTAIDSCVVTNAAGEFIVTADRPIQHAVYRVHARGLATRMTPKLMPDRFAHLITMNRGTEVSGRIMHQGQPVAGVTVVLAQTEYSAGRYVGESEIATDHEGRFRFENVPPQRSYLVFAKMRSLARLGTLPVSRIESAASETKIDIGDLHVQPGERASGQVVMNRPAPLPPDARLVVSCTLTGDAMSVSLPSDGRFNIGGLPPQGYTLRVKRTGLGWHHRRPAVPRMPAPRGRMARDLVHLTICLDGPAGASPDGRPSLGSGEPAPIIASVTPSAVAAPAPAPAPPIAAEAIAVSAPLPAAAADALVPVR